MWMFMSEGLILPSSGQLWRHHSGRVYRVERVTNTAHPSEKYPPTVVYVNVVNGTEWSRALSDWHRSFTFAGPAPVRAAGTEGGATDGMGTRVVEWPGEDEITRLRAEVERLTAERDDPVMVALRRVRSGEIVGYMASDVVILSLAQADSEHEVVIRLRAEVERLTDAEDEASGNVSALRCVIDDLRAENARLTKERDEARRTVEDQSFLIVENIQDHADRRARDVLAVRAGIEAAAEGSAQWHETAADLLVAGGGWDARVDAHRRYARIHRERIPAIDPEAVLKAMEARDG